MTPASIRNPSWTCDPELQGTDSVMYLPRGCQSAYCGTEYDCISVLLDCSGRVRRGVISFLLTADPCSCRETSAGRNPCYQIWPAGRHLGSAASDDWVSLFDGYKCTSILEARITELLRRFSDS